MAMLMPLEREVQQYISSAPDDRPRVAFSRTVELSRELVAHATRPQHTAQEALALLAKADHWAAAAVTMAPSDGDAISALAEEGLEEGQSPPRLRKAMRRKSMAAASARVGDATVPPWLQALQAQLRAALATRDVHKSAGAWPACLESASKALHIELDIRQRLQRAHPHGLAAPSLAAYQRGVDVSVGRSMLNVSGLHGRLGDHNAALTLSRHAAEHMDGVAEEVQDSLELLGLGADDPTTEATTAALLAAEQDRAVAVGVLRTAAWFNTGCSEQRAGTDARAFDAYSRGLTAATEAALPADHMLAIKLRDAHAILAPTYQAAYDRAQKRKEASADTRRASKRTASIAARTAMTTTTATAAPTTATMAASTMMTPRRRPSQHASTETMPPIKGATPKAEREAPDAERGAKVGAGVSSLPLSARLAPSATAGADLSAGPLSARAGRVPPVAKAPLGPSARKPRAPPAVAGVAKAPTRPRPTGHTTAGATFTLAGPSHSKSGKGQSASTPPPVTRRALLPPVSSSTAGTPAPPGSAPAPGRSPLQPSPVDPAMAAVQQQFRGATTLPAAPPKAPLRGTHTENPRTAAIAKGLASSVRRASPERSAPRSFARARSQPKGREATPLQSARLPHYARSKAKKDEDDEEAAGPSAVIAEKTAVFRERYAASLAPFLLPTVERYHRREAAAVKVQSAWRAHAARTEADARRQALYGGIHTLQRTAVRVILNRYRTLRLQRQVAAAVEAARQRRVAEAQRQELEFGAVVIITRTIKRFQVRRREEEALLALLEVKERARLQLLATAALMVQRWWAAVLPERRYWRRRDLEIVQQREEEARALRETSAATNISRVWRGHAGRREASLKRRALAARRSQWAARVNAAIDVVRVVLRETRARETRLLLQAEHDGKVKAAAARKIQATWHIGMRRQATKAAADRARRVLAAACRIQRCYRSHRARRDLRVLRKVKIAGNELRVEREWRQARAARVLQCAWRMFLARGMARRIKASYGRRCLEATWLLQRTMRGLVDRMAAGVERSAIAAARRAAAAALEAARQRAALLCQIALRAHVSQRLAVVKQQRRLTNKVELRREVRTELRADRAAAHIARVTVGGYVRRAVGAAWRESVAEAKRLDAAARVVGGFAKLCAAKRAKCDRRAQKLRDWRHRAATVEALQLVHERHVEAFVRLEAVNRRRLEEAEVARIVDVLFSARDAGVRVPGVPAADPALLPPRPAALDDAQDAPHDSTPARPADSEPREEGAEAPAPVDVDEYVGVDIDRALYAGLESYSDASSVTHDDPSSPGSHGTAEPRAPHGPSMYDSGTDDDA